MCNFGRASFPQNPSGAGFQPFLNFDLVFHISDCYYCHPTSVSNWVVSQNGPLRYPLKTNAAFDERHQKDIRGQHALQPG